MISKFREKGLLFSFFWYNEIMKTHQTFAQKIEDTFVRHGRIPFIVTSCMILISVVGVYVYNNIVNIDHIHAAIVQKMNDIEVSVSDSFTSDSWSANTRIEADINRAYQMYYKLNSQLSNHLSVIIFDQSNQPVFITQPALRGHNYLTYYQSLILEQLNHSENIMTTFPGIEGEPRDRLLIARTSVDGSGQPIKLFYIIESNAFRSILDTWRSRHIVLTDRYDNVFASTTTLFVDSYNKLNLQSDETTQQKSLYAFKTRTLSGRYSITVAVAKIRVSWEIMMLVTLYLVTLFLIQRLNKQSARRIGKEIATSVGALQEAVTTIGSGNLDVSIALNSGDEFETLALAFEDMSHQLQLAIDKNADLLELQKNAELKQLEAQFNPHFLFNSLEVVRYLMVDDVIASQRLILGITKMLRYSIRKDKSTVRLSDDLEYIRIYLEVHKLRLQERFNYTIEIEDDILDTELPKLILQPLIENCIKHGYQNQQTINVGVIGYKRQNTTYFHVLDDGSGMDAARVVELNDPLQTYASDSYGIKSVIQRIKLIYGEGGAVVVESDHHGTHITIKIQEDFDDV